MPDPVWSARPDETSKAAKSRQQLVEEAKNDRQARKLGKQRVAAAIEISRAWRGYADRKLVLRKVCNEIITQYQPLIPDTSNVLPPPRLVTSLLQPLCILSLSHDPSRPRRPIVPVSCRKHWVDAFRIAVALTLRSLTVRSQSNLTAYAMSTQALLAQSPFSLASPSFYTAFALLCAFATNPQGPLAPMDPTINAAAARCVLHLVQAPLPSDYRQTPTTFTWHQKLCLEIHDILAGHCALFTSISAVLTCAATSASAPRSYPTTDSQPEPTNPQNPNLSHKLLSYLLKAACLLLAPEYPPVPASAMMSTSSSAEDSRHVVHINAVRQWVSTVLSNPYMLHSYHLFRSIVDKEPEMFFGPILSFLAMAMDSAMSSMTALMALSAVSSLLAGPSSARTLKRGHRVYLLQPSQLLQNKELRAVYVQATFAVMQRAAAAGVGRSGSAGAGDLAAVLDQLWPFTQSVHLTDMTAAKAEKLNVHVGNDGLLAGVPCAKDVEDGLDVIIGTYASLVQVCDMIQEGNPGRTVVDPLIHLLAFNDDWMKQLWKRVATRCKMPLDIPAQAQLCLDIPSLKGGIAAYSAWEAKIAELFFRLLAHLLTVLDDEAFHHGSEPFNIATYRANSLALNSLVFHSYMRRRRSGAAKMGHQQERLSASAERCLQLLYLRHVRKPFCSEEAWLAPWRAMCEDDEHMREGKLFMNAVLYIMVGRSHEESDGHEGSKPQTAHSRTGSAAAVVDLLQVAPQSVPYSLRVDLFRDLLKVDKEAGNWAGPGAPAARRIQIHRTNIVSDAFQQLAALGTAIKGPLSVQFINEHGMVEAGIDQGGLLKELLEQLLHQGFDPNYGLMQFTADAKVFPSPTASSVANGLSLVEFLGLVVGKALYEGMLLDLQLAPLFVMALQRRHPVLEDLYTLDPDLYKSLVQIKNYDGNVEDLGLYFAASEEVFGERLERDLIAKGRDTPVTDENKLMYVHLLAHWHVSRINGAAAAAFARGLSQVIPISFLRMFTVNEVNELLGGGSGEGVNVEDMQAYCLYDGGYTANSTTIKVFWRVVSQMDTSERRELLKFITGTRRAPLGGFQHLEPRLTVYKVDCSASPFARVGGKDVEHLPSASTCFNMLKLPNYRKQSTMKKKLLLAIHSKAGFDLS